MIEFKKHITRSMLSSESSTLFVFGDNLERKGMGGQAKEMRGEVNAVGIPTKRAPAMSSSAFFTDRDFEEWRQASLPDWRRLFAHAKVGGKIVWPADGIGTGLARLQESAPTIAAAIERNLAALEKVVSYDRSEISKLRADKDSSSKEE
ncbi:hypothetical protein [uncultured Sneathiella sp.]|jgi:hypothetical protein|uniref:DUF7831 domain-containing protein n=1 Tax=uncultured Sneathiella sp. TaxID=879315 RepID=UPI0030EEBF87|tara:strand:- start:1004 stop:1450 length:447 start_codon:yes stop_codon:yes gene_type:complete